MNIEGSVALVTGANRGFGAALTTVLLERGAAKVYAGARDPDTVTRAERVVPVRLDVTSASDVAAVAGQCGDLTILINNAGVGSGSSSRADDVVGAAREVFETNLFGPMALSQALAPSLAANGGGAIVNVQSVLAWMAVPSIDYYSASKAAGWSFTNSLRLQLADQGT